MTTLNGIPRSWDSFIQGICARKKLVKFSRLWEECSQEEARITAREEKNQRWEVNRNISWYTPRKPEEVLITPEVSPSIKITLENICLESDVIHVTRKDTMLENVLETKMSLTRRRETREDIILMP